jgi:hypothetical protein
MATLVTRYVNAGSSGGDGTTQALTGSTAAYASLAAWQAARFRNLVSADEIEEVICEGSTEDAITATLLLSGWTTDATRYVSIKAGPNDRATTKWSNSKYRITLTPTGGGNTIENSSILYLRIDGLQIGFSVASFNSATRAGYVLFLNNLVSGTSGSDCRVSNCYLRYFGASGWSAITAGSYWGGVMAAPGTTSANPVPNFYIYNNVISYEVTVASSWTANTYGIRSEYRDQNVYIYNNTIVGAWRIGISGDNNNTRYHHLRNNLIYGCGVDSTNEYAARCDYNATDRSSLGYTANTHDRVSQTFSFVASDDFALTSSDTGAKGYGVTNPGSDLYIVDINGNSRTVPWDIGAYELSSRRRAMVIT